MTTDGHSRDDVGLRANEAATAAFRQDNGSGRSSGAAVFLNEPVEDVVSDDSPASASLDRVVDLRGDLLSYPLVRALGIEVGDELAKDPPKVALADNDEVPENLATNR